jgi:hypothetical protein
MQTSPSISMATESSSSVNRNESRPVWLVLSVPVANPVPNWVKPEVLTFSFFPSVLLAVKTPAYISSS